MDTTTTTTTTTTTAVAAIAAIAAAAIITTTAELETAPVSKTMPVTETTLIARLRKLLTVSNKKKKKPQAPSVVVDKDQTKKRAKNPLSRLRHWSKTWKEFATRRASNTTIASSMDSGVDVATLVDKSTEVGHRDGSVGSRSGSRSDHADVVAPASAGCQQPSTVPSDEEPSESSSRRASGEDLARASEECALQEQAVTMEMMSDVGKVEQCELVETMNEVDQGTIVSMEQLEAMPSKGLEVKALEQRDVERDQKKEQGGAEQVQEVEEQGAQIVDHTEQRGTEQVQEVEERGATIIDHVEQRGAEQVQEKEERDATIVDHMEQRGAEQVQELEERDATIVDHMEQQDAELDVSSEVRDTGKPSQLPKDATLSVLPERSVLRTAELSDATVQSVPCDAAASTLTAVDQAAVELSSELELSMPGAVRNVAVPEPSLLQVQQVLTANEPMSQPETMGNHEVETVSEKASVATSRSEHAVVRADALARQSDRYYASYDEDDEDDYLYQHFSLYYCVQFVMFVVPLVLFLMILELVNYIQELDHTSDEKPDVQQQQQQQQQQQPLETTTSLSGRKRSSDEKMPNLKRMRVTLETDESKDEDESVFKPDRRRRSLSEPVSYRSLEIQVMAKTLPERMDVADTKEEVMVAPGRCVRTKAKTVHVSVLSLKVPCVSLPKSRSLASLNTIATDASPQLPAPARWASCNISTKLIKAAKPKTKTEDVLAQPLVIKEIVEDTAPTLIHQVIARPRPAATSELHEQIMATRGRNKFRPSSLKMFPEDPTILVKKISEYPDWLSPDAALQARQQLKVVQRKTVTFCPVVQVLGPHTVVVEQPIQIEPEDTASIESSSSSSSEFSRRAPPAYLRWRIKNHSFNTPSF